MNHEPNFDLAPCTLELVHGELRVRHWPSMLPPLFGLRASDACLLGPPRLRHSVLRALTDAGLPCTDTIVPPPLAADDRPPSPSPPPAAFAAWQAAGSQGVIAGLDAGTCLDCVLAAAHTTRSRTLLVVRDSGAVLRWQGDLAQRGFAAAPAGASQSPLAVVTTADAAATMHWRARCHDLLVVDQPEQQPSPALHTVLDGSAALHRLGFVARAGRRRLLEWARGLGNLLADHEPAATPRRVHLHLPLTASERADYEAAWHSFLGAYDAFVATQPRTGFATFVQQARADARQRPALSAWHRAVQRAAWNVAKATAVADLLARHHGARVLVFTPDRASTYELSRAHLIAPLTAELPLAERRATLAAFAARRLCVLVGPRLLDLGVPEHGADVGILVGGGFGEAQRQARLRRIAPGGIAYELVAQHTIEVGRARDGAAATLAPAGDVADTRTSVDGSRSRAP